MSHLIAAVGDDNVRFQNLDMDAHAIDKTKHGTKITFYTNQMQAEELLGGGMPKMQGVVIWMPRDKVEAAIAAVKASKRPNPERLQKRCEACCGTGRLDSGDECYQRCDMCGGEGMLP